jgi:ABC-type polysaccharide/polyol phosphate transport system ATPase subunit
MAIISCQHVSKRFQRQTGQKLLRHHLSTWFRKRPSDTFYALKDVSFSLREGESLGICGSNGAGKSTLLNLITGLGRPDTGIIEVNGRVSALLELGAGFHPDLTGAENVKLNAALLGFSRKAATALFESIVDFSGVGDFINEPLRTYSSGMTLRLAFAVAISVEPDILIIDEILAVGDQQFQAKCQQRIRTLRERGTSFVCVSHSPEMLLEFCDTGLWLDHGEAVLQGGMHDVLHAYQGHLTAHAQGL